MKKLSAVFSILMAFGFFTLATNQTFANSYGYEINVCGDSTPGNNYANWLEHNANPICSGCREGDKCTGSDVRVYKCTSFGQTITQNGGTRCEYQRVNGNSTSESFSSWFTNPCEMIQIDVYNSGQRTDFITWRGNQFGTCSTGGGNTGGGNTGGGNTSTGTGSDVYVCGDSTPTNGNANWGEHNANSLCSGCTQGNGCSGSIVEVYKCYSTADLGPNSAAYECRKNMVYQGSGHTNFSQWFNDDKAVVQIDVFDSNHNLKDFVIWQGSQFGQNNGGGGNPNPTLSCNRICTDPNNCPFYNPQTQQTFRDVPASNPYFVYIENLECENVVHGYSDGYFKPYNALTRGQMAKIIANGYSFPENTFCTPFSDVAPGSTFYIYIMTLKCNGVITGFPDNTFRENYLVTRGEAMKFVINGARKAIGDNGFLPNTTNYQVYNDVPTSHPFFEYINAAYSNGIKDPNYPGNYFYPGNVMTRQEMAFYVDSVRLKLKARGWAG